MTTEEFNALPLEARRFIETHAGCLSCGNSSSKLTKAYELYKSQKMAQAYVLFGGGINYQIAKERGVLYNVREGDTPNEIREKLRIAGEIYEKSPEVFVSYDEREIADLLESMPEEDLVDLRSEEEIEADEDLVDLRSEEEIEADEAWAERSEMLGIDTRTAEYPELQDFVKARGLKVAGQKKSQLVEAIDALDATETDL